MAARAASVHLMYSRILTQFTLPHNGIPGLESVVKVKRHHCQTPHVRHALSPKSWTHVPTAHRRPPAKFKSALMWAIIAITYGFFCLRPLRITQGQAHSLVRIYFETRMRSTRTRCQNPPTCSIIFVYQTLFPRTRRGWGRYLGGRPSIILSKVFLKWKDF